MWTNIQEGKLIQFKNPLEEMKYAYSRHTTHLWLIYLSRALRPYYGNHEYLLKYVARAISAVVLLQML